MSSEHARNLKDFLGFSSINELYVYLKSLDKKVFSYDRKRYESQIKKFNTYVPIILKYLIEQTFVDKIIADNLRDDIPKWINRDELIYELRRNFPIVAFEEHFFGPKGIKKDYWGFIVPKINLKRDNPLTVYEDILNWIKTIPIDVVFFSK